MKTVRGTCFSKRTRVEVYCVTFILLHFCLFCAPVKFVLVLLLPSRSLPFIMSVDSNQTCFKCTAPFRASKQGISSFLKCKNPACARLMHPACSMKVSCCNDSSLEVVHLQTKRSRRMSASKVSQYSSDKSSLDRSFSCVTRAAAPPEDCFESAMQDITMSMGVAFSDAAMDITESITGVGGDRADASSVVGKSISNRSIPAPHPTVSDQVTPVASCAATVANFVGKISKTDPMFVIAQALQAMAISNDSTNLKLDIIASDNRKLQTDSLKYFSKTDTLEKQVAELTAKDFQIERLARDASAAARAAEQGCSPNQLVVIGLPSADLRDVRDAFVAIGKRIGLDLDHETVVSVKSRRPAVASKSNTDDLDSSAEEGLPTVEPSTELFVTLKYAELREIILRKTPVLNKLQVSELGIACAIDRRLMFFEVLSAHRHHEFVKLRKRAAELKIFKTYHRNGTFYIRRTQQSSAERVFDVDDLVANSD